MNALLIGSAFALGLVAQELPYQVWVLDNSDPNFTIPPYEDTLTVLDHAGQVNWRSARSNVSQGIGDWRSFSVSPDGGHAILAEHAYSPGSALSRYEATGQRTWLLRFNEDIATVDHSENGFVYALAGTTISGDEILKIDPRNGDIVDRSKRGGVDLVVDDAGGCIWIVGSDIKKLSLDLELCLTIDPIGWAALSVDLTSQGDVWLAEHMSAGGSNRLLKVSRSGHLLRSVPGRYKCVSVDPYSDAVWAVLDFPAELHKFDGDGQPLLQVVTGQAWSVQAGPPDGSVWLAGYGDVRHFSQDGLLLHRTRGFSFDQAHVEIGAAPPR